MITRGLHLIPIAPLESIASHIIDYWKMRKTDVEILQLLKDEHIDREIYGLGYTIPLLMLLNELTLVI